MTNFKNQKHFQGESHKIRPKNPYLMCCFYLIFLKTVSTLSNNNVNYCWFRSQNHFRGVTLPTFSVSTRFSHLIFFKHTNMLIVHSSTSSKCSTNLVSTKFFTHTHTQTTNKNIMNY